MVTCLEKESERNRTTTTSKSWRDPKGTMGPGIGMNNKFFLIPKECSYPEKAYHGTKRTRIPQEPREVHTSRQRFLEYDHSCLS